MQIIKQYFYQSLVVFFGVMFLWSSAHAATPILLPLGDSITQGWPSDQFPFSYRGHLQELLGAGVYDFVGPFQSGTGGDPDHSGVAGEETPAILARLRNNLTQYFVNAPPGSGVLIHAGTNDMNNGNNVDSAFANITQMVDAIAQKSATIDIYLGTIVPIIGGQNEAVQALNAKIRQYVQTKKMPQLHLVDHYGAFVAIAQWQDVLMNDSVHPNTRGYELMAQTWAQAIVVAHSGGQTQTATQQAQEQQTTTSAATAQDVQHNVATQSTQATQATAQTIKSDCRTVTDAQSVKNPYLIPTQDTEVDCVTRQFRVHGTQNTYTYKTAYLTTNGNTFTDSASLTGVTDASGQWIIGDATGAFMALSFSTAQNYIATYSCQKRGITFYCGCTKEGTCSDPLKNIFYWYTQGFNLTK